jgi:hypothetical protein
MDRKPLNFAQALRRRPGESTPAVAPPADNAHDAPQPAPDPEISALSTVTETGQVSPTRQPPQISHIIEARHTTEASHTSAESHVRDDADAVSEARHASAESHVTKTGHVRKKTQTLAEMAETLEYGGGHSRTNHDFFDGVISRLPGDAQLLWFHLNRYREGQLTSTVRLNWPRLEARTGRSRSTLYRAAKVLKAEGLAEQFDLDLGRGKDQGFRFRLFLPKSLLSQTSHATQTRHVRETNTKREKNLKAIDEKGSGQKVEISEEDEQQFREAGGRFQGEE